MLIDRESTPAGSMSGADAYRREPLTDTELESLVATLLARDRYDELIQEYYQSISLLTMFEALHDETDLHSNLAYQDIKTHVTTLEEELEAVTDRLIAHDALDSVFEEMCKQT